MSLSTLAIRLFGKFEVQLADRELESLNTCKVQELLAYLLLYRQRSHLREVLASLLWPNSTPEKARKYLRDVLWKLQRILTAANVTDADTLLFVDPDWICLNPDIDLWVDVIEFEHVYGLVKKTAGHEMDKRGEQAVRGVLKLYRGELLEGWYQDWCLFERERLQQLYLILLEKEIDYCAAHGEYEIGLECGVAALRCDVAHERIHRRLMRLHFLAGNRSAALHQYERCVTLLREELGVDPSARTVTLYEQIRADQPIDSDVTVAPIDREGRELIRYVPNEALYHLKQLQTAFAQAEQQLQKTIQLIETALSNQNDPITPKRVSPIDVGAGAPTDAAADDAML